MFRTLWYHCLHPVYSLTATNDDAASTYHITLRRNCQTRLFPSKGQFTQFTQALFYCFEEKAETVGAKTAKPLLWPSPSWSTPWPRPLPPTQLQCPPSASSLLIVYNSYYVNLLIVRTLRVNWFYGRQAATQAAPQVVELRSCQVLLITQDSFPLFVPTLFTPAQIWGRTL